MKRLTIIFIFLETLLLFSQPVRLTIQQIDTSLYPRIKVFLSVLDPNNEPMLGLKNGNFEIRENGNLIENFQISTVFKNSEWISIVLALDKSGSMKGEPIEQAKKSAKNFLKLLGLGDRVSLLTFDTDINLESDFVQDKEGLNEKIEKILAGRDTALYDAVVFSIEKSKNFNAPRKAIVILTDGKDTRSKNNLSKTLKAIKEAEIPIFTIGLGDKVNKNVLEEIASISGGSYFQAYSPEELINIYKKIAHLLENQYVLIFESPSEGRRNVGLIKVALKYNGITLEEKRYYSILQESSLKNLPSKKVKPFSIYKSLIFSISGGILGLILFLLLFSFSENIRKERITKKTILAFLSILLFVLFGMLLSLIL